MRRTQKMACDYVLRLLAVRLRSDKICRDSSAHKKQHLDNVFVGYYSDEQQRGMTH